jgi:hypothetical protein
MWHLTLFGVLLLLPPSCPFTPARTYVDTGAPFGGATGVLFYLCYVANCAFNATAFVEDIVDTYLPEESPKNQHIYGLYVLPHCGLLAVVCTAFRTHPHTYASDLPPTARV